MLKSSDYVETVLESNFLIIEAAAGVAVKLHCIKASGVSIILSTP